MYYEGRISKIKHFNNLEELLNAISQNFFYNVLYTFNIDNTLYGFANDQRNCETICEAAILNLTNQTQIESVTLDWIKGDKIFYFTELFKNPSPMKSSLPFKIIDNEIVQNKPILSWFECGCCGTSFKSDYKYQMQFDQDSGYGICSECE